MDEWILKWFRICLILVGLHFLFWIGILTFAGISDNLIPSYTVFLIIMITILFIFRKKIFKIDGGKHKPHDIFNLKLFLIYWTTYTAGYFLSVNIIPFINTKNNIYFIFLLTGLTLELSAKVCQMFIHKKLYITLDKWFVLWVILLSIFSLIIIKLLEYLNIIFSNPIYEIITVSFGVTVLVHLAWRIMYGK